MIEHEKLAIGMAETDRQLLGGLFVAVACFVVGGLLLYYVYRSVRVGTVWLCSKFNPRRVFRKEEPVGFWITIVLYSGLAAMLLYGALHGIYHDFSLKR